MRLFILTCLVFAYSFSKGQSGHYFLSHFTTGQKQSNAVCFDMLQDDNSLIYLATQRGLTQFDGREWVDIGGKGSIYSIQKHSDGLIYWAGLEGYGYLGKDENGILQLVTLSKKETRNVLQVLSANDKIIFITDNNIIVHAGYKDVSPQTIPSNNITGTFLNAFELFGMAFVNTEYGGVQKISQGKLIKPTLNFPAYEEIVFSTPLQNLYLIGTSENKVFFCGENLKMHELPLEDAEYIEASVVINGRWVNKNLFALSTLRGGIIFVNAATGQTQEIINYATGLPDNEVSALMSDKNQCIWVAHEYGYTRISPYVPLRSFSHYPGLQGNLLCAVTFQNEVYAGTSLGLFKLEQQEVYDEITYYIDVPIENEKKELQKPNVKQEAKQAEQVQLANTKPLPETTAEKKKGIFSFLKRKRTENIQENPVSTSSSEATAASKQEEAPLADESTATSGVTPAKQYKRVKRTERVLRASSYVYKKVQGVNAKITQLVAFNSKLIAAGLGGAFEVQGLSAKTILDEPTRFAYASKRNNILFLSTYNDEVISLRAEKSGWAPLTLLDDIDDRINYIFEGNGNDLWLCAVDNIYKLEVEKDFIHNLKVFPIKNTNYEEFAGIDWNNEIILAKGDGFQRYDHKKDQFVTIDSLSKNVLNYFADGNNIWYRDAHTWGALGKIAGKSNLKLLNLFRNLRFI
jgi:hypothetical protein